jgi:amino acid adenylation domain-containing protein
MLDHHLVRRLAVMDAEALRRAAFIWEGGALHLGELRKVMLRFSTWLDGAFGQQPGNRVAVCLPKSAEALQAMYGILAAGAAYVPLPFQGPPGRLAAILASVRPRLLMTTPEIAGQLGGAAAPPVLEIDLREDGSGLEPILRGVRARSTVVDVGPDDLAWLLFTSGSTGEPKGVMLSHRNMAANVGWMQQRDRMTERDLRLSHAALHYIGAYDLLFPMVGGVRMFLLPENEAKFPEHVAAVMERERATLWSSSATALRLLLERGSLERRDLAALRRVSFYGEPMPMPALRRLMAALPGAELSNHYGATEIDNIANFEVPRPLPEDLDVLPLGRPTEHCTVSLRDEAGAEVGPGEIGEICVVSEGVTTGYWEDPALTADRRLEGRANSFRTRDLAVLGADGLLRSVGRADQMVKIRGHRLDLGEVEAVLRRHPAVRDAVAFATAIEAGDVEIAAVVLTEGRTGCDDGLRGLCRRYLPSHAQPARIVTLAQFPLLPTGKLDRRRLRAIAEQP